MATVADNRSVVAILAAKKRERARPKVLIVGGCDVHKRIDLMLSLARDFDVSAAGSEPQLSEVFSRQGLTFFYYPLERGYNPLADVRSIVCLVRLFRRQRPDIVHAFATKPCVWSRLAAHYTRVPRVLGTLPGLGSLYSSNDVRTRIVRGLYQKLQQAACRRSDCTIFQNESDAREFIGAGIAPRERSYVIRGSGVRTDLLHRAKVSGSEISRVRAEVGALPETLLVTMISRVIRSKGVLEFAEAAKLLRHQHGNLRFLLVGPDDRESFDRLSSEERDRLSGSVTWVGERHDIVSILASSDIFVLPSYREGIPRVLVEAASMGLPLVATRAPGCEEVVREGENGFLVEPRDPAAIAGALERLIVNLPLRQRFGAASRALAVKQFDHAVIARRTADLYWRLLRGGGDR